MTRFITISLDSETDGLLESKDVENLSEYIRNLIKADLVDDSWQKKQIIIKMNNLRKEAELIGLELNFEIEQKENGTA